MTVHIKESVTVNAPAKNIFKLLWSVKTYPDIFPQISKASEKKKGDKKEAVFETDLLGKISYTLLMEQEPPSLIKWSLIKGDMMKSNEGAWIIKEKNGKTHLTYKMDVELSAWIPDSIAQNLLTKHLPNVMNKIKEKMENK